VLVSSFEYLVYTRRVAVPAQHASSPFIQSINQWFKFAGWALARSKSQRATFCLCER
jgi:hypothetical protein